MLIPVRTTKFKKDLQRSVKRGKSTSKLKTIMEKNEVPLDPKYRNHKLTGGYKGHWECHIEPDWLLIYRLTKEHIIFERLGTHSDLFKE